MKRTLTLLTLSSISLLAESKITIDEALLEPGSVCSFCQKDRPGPVMLKAGVIVWQSKQWGLEFISKSLNPSITSFKEKLYVPDFSWSPGFKIDFGFNIPRDNWDVLSRWTFYHGDFTNLKKHFDSQIAPASMGLVPLWNYPFLQIATDVSDVNPLRFGSAASNWKLYFNSFDLNLGRGFVVADPFTLRMFCGAKGSYVRQHYHVDYNDGTTVSAYYFNRTPSDYEYLSSRMVFNSSEWGVGPSGGLNSRWKIGKGFSLLADFAASCLCSFFNLKTEFSDHLYTNENVDFDLKLKEHLWQLIPVFEGDIGLDWGYCFGNKNNPYYLGLTVAYEFQYWFSQNHAKRPFATNAPGNMWDMKGDLQMQGLTASIRSDF